MKNIYPMPPVEEKREKNPLQISWKTSLHENVKFLLTWILLPKPSVKQLLSVLNFEGRTEVENTNIKNLQVTSRICLKSRVSRWNIGLPLKFESQTHSDMF